MRISDWSSDVCSSDLGDQDIALAHILPAKPNVQIAGQLPEGRARIAALVSEGTGNAVDEIFRRPALRQRGEIGRIVMIGFPVVYLAAQFAIAALHAGPRCIEQEIGRDTSELQSLMSISYAVFCLEKK